MLSTKQKASLLYKHHLGVGSTRDNREFFEEAIKSSFVVRPDQLWTYSDRIPDGTDATGGADAIAEIINLGLNGRDSIFYHYISEDQDKVPLVKRWIDLPLTMIDKGTDNAFLIADENGEQIKNIVPFNYHEEYYNYTLKTANGTRIPFGVGDWQVDIYSGIVTFYGELPDGVDHDNPPLLSFYQYIGGNGFRQDTYGYDGAILPLDSIEIAAGSCVLTNGSEGRSLYQHIVDKTNEIQDNFVDIFGWDGSNKNEGIALSFEKIIPLTYTHNLDAVKGYDKAANSEIGTLLSDKVASIVGAASSKYEIVFVSQKADPLDKYTIKIENGVAVAHGLDGEDKDPTTLAGNEWGLYKVWISDTAFVVLKVLEEGDEEITFSVQDVKLQEDKTITALLLYWSDEDRQYQPFLPKEDVLGNFGFPVVTINGRLPPSVQLGTAALATFSDVITPDYYGPRSFAVVIAKEDGTDIKSADYIVKNREDWYLNDIFAQILTRYTENFRGTVFLRAGTYQTAGDLDLSVFKNIILAGENYHTIIDLQGRNLIISNDVDSVFELDHIKFINVGEVQVTSKGNIFISETTFPKTTPITVYAYNGSSTYLNYLSAGDLTIEGEADSELINVNINGCMLANVAINKDKVYLKNSSLNELSISTDKTIVLRSNVINKLKNKYKETFIEGNMIFEYSGIAPAAANQIPVGTAADHEIINFNRDTLTTTGRFPIFSKDDAVHTKYAEFASPFNYNETYNIIELLYDPDTMKIVDGKLTTTLSASQIAMDEESFERHENSGLPAVHYGPENNLNDVFRHIYKWKADLGPNGKVPLQELPDSVAYGGLLFVGTWSFEKNNGNYPTFRDAQINLSEDKVVNELQPGWFFIVEEADDLTDEDTDDDTPVATQIAVDGVEFTAGDWVVFEGAGEKFKKVDWSKAVTFRTNGYVITNKNALAETGNTNIFQILTEETIDDQMHTGWNGDGFLTIRNGIVETIATDIASLREELAAGTDITKYDLECTYTETQGSPKWIKVDRAYSDPTYSPLPYYAKVPHITNLDWYWKRNRNAGALDLSNNTIIEAFKKVNDQLRKLEPKKPAHIKDVKVEFDKDYPQVSYRKWVNGNISAPITKYDTTDLTEYNFKTFTDENGNRTYKELIFFGDKAHITVKIDNEVHEFDITTESEAQSDDKVFISAPTESMTFADHGEQFWKGFYVTLKNDFIEDGQHTVVITLDDVEVVYDDGTVDTYQFSNYNGVSNTIVYDTYKPYFPSVLRLLPDTHMSYPQTTLAEMSKRDACSGIRKINLANFKNFPISEFIVEKVYKDLAVPTGPLAELEVLLNDSIPFCDKIDISDYVTLEANTDYPAAYRDLRVEDLMVPVTYENKNDILPENCTLDFYLTVYDLYNEPHRIKIHTYTGMRFDPTEESERCSAGDFNEDSLFKDFPKSFGKTWVSDNRLSEELYKIGELVDGKPVGVYQQPTEVYNETVGSNIWTGQKIGEEHYGTACFNIGHITDATGFTFKVEGLPSDMSTYNFDKLSGTTNDVLYQVCLVEPNEVDHSNSKVTSFLDANAPYDGFSKVDEKDFLYPVMYAGNSTAIEKRITFGRKKIFSGDVYVRIAIKKDSGLRFTGIKLIEEI